jgi:RHS repeat-associated protein
VTNGIVYDAENRQTQHTKSNQLTNYYYYDGDGRRVKKIDNSGTTIFVYNVSGQLIAEYHSDPVPPPAGGGGTSYLTSDHLGSTRVVTKSDATVKARYDYLPYGEELGAGIGQRTTGMGYSGADSTKQKFTQKERDSESGLDYFLARYYSSAHGRFTGADDFLNDTRTKDPSSWNLYVYVRNNPLAYVDAGGEEVNSANLTDEQKKQVIDDWKKKTGFKSIYFDDKNKLVIDASAGFRGGSATARTELLGAVNSTSNVFNLRAVSGAEAGAVAFADNSTDHVTVDSRTGQRTEIYDTRIDFEDFKHLEGDKDAQKAFTIGIVILHEFEHGLHAGTMLGTDNPRALGFPGSIETFIINHIRAELGLARRFEYSAIRNLTGRNPGYAEVRFAKEGKLKILRWKEDVVGGRRN